MTKIYQFSLQRKAMPDAGQPRHSTPVVDQVKTEAERVLEEARKRADEIVLSAHQEAQQKISEHVSKTLVDFNRFISVSETELANLVTGCVRKLLGTLPQPEVPAMLLRTALADFRSNRKITMRVPPSQRFNGPFAVLRDTPEFSEVIESVVSDPSLESNECVIEVRGAKVQLGLEQQLRALEEALSQSNRNGR